MDPEVPPLSRRQMLPDLNPPTPPTIASRLLLPLPLLEALPQVSPHSSRPRHEPVEDM